MMVAMFFTVSVVNNYCLHFNIPLPLHMIFRSVSVVGVAVGVANQLCCDNKCFSDNQL